MGIIIGLDIGAVSLKLAAVGTPDDHQTLQSLARSPEAFSAAPFPQVPALTGGLCFYQEAAARKATPASL